jgi:hypothetical protein
MEIPYRKLIGDITGGLGSRAQAKGYDTDSTLRANISVPRSMAMARAMLLAS